MFTEHNQREKLRPREGTQGQTMDQYVQWASSLLSVAVCFLSKFMRLNPACSVPPPFSSSLPLILPLFHVGNICTHTESWCKFSHPKLCRAVYKLNGYFPITHSKENCQRSEKNPREQLCITPNGLFLM